jgi:hypothetical protein
MNNFVANYGIDMNLLRLIKPREQVRPDPLVLDMGRGDISTLIDSALLEMTLSSLPSFCRTRPFLQFFSAK